MSTVSSISPISPSDPFLLLSRYVIKPVDRIGHLLFWGSMTVGVTLGTFQFGLIMLEEILPTYTFLWGI